MKRRSFLCGGLAVLIQIGVAVRKVSADDAPIISDADWKKAREVLDEMKEAGVPLDHVRFAPPDLTPDEKERLKRYRVVKYKDWKAMDDAARRAALDNVKNLNENYFVCLPDGNVYSITDDDDFEGRATNYDQWPAGFLTDAEYDELIRLRDGSSSSNSNAAQPPEKPGGGGGGD